jgi:DNA-binding protein YbaB
VRQLKIDDSVVGEDKEMLEDLVVAAFNDAVRKAEAAVKEKYSGLAGGLNLPPGIKLPF